MKYRVSTHLSQTAQSLFQDPGKLVLIQLPQILLIALQHVIDSQPTLSPFLAFVISFPIYTLCTVFCTAMTYLILRSRQVGEPPSLSRAFRLTLKSAGALSQAAILVGLAIVLGFALIVLPGLFLMSLYLFVPYLILDEPGGSIWNYLHRSSTFPQKRYARFLAMSFFSFSISIGTYLWGLYWTEAFTQRPLLSFVLECGVGILSAVFLDVLIAQFYFLNREERAGSAT